MLVAVTVPTAHEVDTTAAQLLEALGESRRAHSRSNTGCELAAALLELNTAAGNFLEFVWHTHTTCIWQRAPSASCGT